MKRRLAYPCLLLASFGWGYVVVPHAHAGSTAPVPHRLAPPIHCTMANRLDVFIDEDNIMWACECEALSSGFTCRWQVIGGVDAVSIRRRIRVRLHVRVVPRLTLLVLA